MADSAPFAVETYSAKGLIKMIFHRNTILAATAILIMAALWFLPTGFEKEHSDEKVKMRIIAVNNYGVTQTGIVKTGDQSAKAIIESGRFKGKEVEAVNHLTGRLEFDRMYQDGDKVLASIDADGENILKATMIDYYRLDKEIILMAVFCVLLLAFSGWVGVRSILSFAFTALVIWKLLLPGLLKGWDPVLSSLGVSALFTTMIIFLVSGIDKKGITACLGSLCGIAFTCVLALIFGREFSIHGAVKPFSETLLYSGFAHLDLTGIFLGGIFLASSGAVMDLAMDIASALNEISDKKPDITRIELTKSGFAVSRMVIGTMTTTLLLAYTGGYTTLLMIFIAQGTPLVNIFNIQYVAAEILHTLVGSIGLVTVAPFTSIVGAFIMTRGKA